MNTGVQFEGLTKKFVPGIGEAQPPTIGPVSFEVPQGVVCALLGANGAGKSTCIKALLGLIRPTSGRSLILGSPSESENWRGRVGYLAEQARIPEHLTAEETLSYVARLKGLPAPASSVQVAALLSRLDLGSAAKRLVRGFSKGMQQRLAVAAALLGDPDVLIFDEPMSGLDPVGRRLVRDLMIERKEHGACILFSTHILPDAEALSDQAVVLSRGAVVAEGTLDRLMGPAASFEVTFVPGAGAGTLDLPMRVRGEAREVTVPPEELETVLGRVRAAGGRLVTVEAVRRSLEALIGQTPKTTEPPQNAQA